jgi:glycosyltransferase involved in cell wall biosynthesis
VVGVAFAVPGSLDTPTGGYAYDRRVITELATLGHQVQIVDLGSGFPRPSPQTRAAAHALLAQTPRGRPMVIDGLALGALPEAAAVLSASRSLVALVHHPLALETGLSAEDADALRKSERTALASVRHIIVTSPATARIVAGDYGIGTDRVTVALPGIDRTAVFRRDRKGPVGLLAVGSLVPRKGYDVLLAALATLAHLPWHLTIVGDRDRSPETTKKLSAQIEALQLDGRVTLAGAVPADALGEFYRDADIFVLASRFEGYGMAFAEAMAHGLPIIGTTAGAIPETVPCDTGILVPPDDVEALAAALHNLATDARARAGLAAKAREAAEQLPTWQDTAKVFDRIIKALA